MKKIFLILTMMLTVSAASAQVDNRQPNDNSVNLRSQPTVVKPVDNTVKVDTAQPTIVRKTAEKNATKPSTVNGNSESRTSKKSTPQNSSSMDAKSQQTNTNTTSPTAPGTNSNPNTTVAPR